MDRNIHDSILTNTEHYLGGTIMNKELRFMINELPALYDMKQNTNKMHFIEKTMEGSTHKKCYLSIVLADKEGMFSGMNKNETFDAFFYRPVGMVVFHIEEEEDEEVNRVTINYHDGYFNQKYLSSDDIEKIYHFKDEIMKHLTRFQFPALQSDLNFMFTGKMVRVVTMSSIRDNTIEWKDIKSLDDMVELFNASWNYITLLRNKLKDYINYVPKNWVGGHIEQVVIFNNQMCTNCPAWPDNVVDEEED